MACRGPRKGCVKVEEQRRGVRIRKRAQALQEWEDEVQQQLFRQQLFGQSWNAVYLLFVDFCNDSRSHISSQPHLYPLPRWVDCCVLLVYFELMMGRYWVHRRSLEIGHISKIRRKWVFSKTEEVVGRFGWIHLWKVQSIWCWSPTPTLGDNGEGVMVGPVLVNTAMSEVFPKYVANEFFRNRTKGIAFLMNPLI